MVGCNVSSTEKAKCVSARVQDCNGAALVLRRDLSYRRRINNKIERTPEHLDEIAAYLNCAKQQEMGKVY